MSYHVGDYIEPADESSPASVASDAIDSLLKLLKNRISLTAEAKDLAEGRLSAAEIYRDAVSWALEHGEPQTISLDALRQILNLSREEAMQQERELKAERGIEVEPEEVEVPFEGEPTWANLAYYVLDTSGQEEMFYKDIAVEAEELKDQYDHGWQKGDSVNVEGTISQIMSRDPRFYKLRRGYYRLTKHNELLSNPSWANLAYFVLKRHDPKRQGMQLQEITEHAVALKEKYSDWRRASARTPSNTASTTMSMDHRFEPMLERGYWRLAAEEAQPTPEPGETTSPPSTRQQAYEEVLACLGRLGKVTQLSFGRTYYALEDHIHLMFRFSKAHRRNDEIEYFLGVTPQYFERIDALGNGFMVFVLGAPDNVLLVPAETFAGWVEGLEPSGSGTWPVAFYQSTDATCLERWVAGQGREDVTAFRNDYTSLRQVLSQAPVTPARRSKAPIRVADLLEAGLLKPGDVVHTKKRPELPATIVDAKVVECEGKQWRYNDWGTHVTGWPAINIYQQFILARTGQTLDDLRKQLRRGLTHH